MYHSIIIRVDGKYIDTWDDWHLIPASRPVIAPPKERTNFVTVGGRSGVLDFSQTLAGKATFDDRTGSMDFYVENDYWDWETAYTTICAALQGKRVQLALEDNPAHYYEGLLYVDKWTSDKGHSKISLKYDLHPDMQTLELESLAFEKTSLEMTPGMETDLLLKVTPTNTFYRKVNITTWPAGIVEVTADGLVRALANGKTEIRASCGKLTAVCRVNVGDGVFWTVEKDLNGCTETNHANKVADGMTYRNTFGAPKGYSLTNALILSTSLAPLGTVDTDDDGKTIAVTLPSVTKSIRIIVGRTPLPDYKVTFDLDCVNVLDPVKTIQKGETVTFHLESVTPYYVIDTITIKMNGYERYNRIAWDGLNAATIILPVDGDIVITAVAKARFTLEECSWGMIDRIAKSGRGGEFFKPGDRKSLGSIDRIGGNSFNYSSTPSNVPMDAILLGINHNPSIEGAGNMHFCIGKHDAEWAYPVTGSYLNSTATNLGGVLGSELMPLIGTEIPAAPVEKAPSADYPDEPAKDTLLWSLPYELTQVLKKAPKTVYDTKTDKVVTERSYLWLLSATEVFGTEKEWGSSTFAYEAESATQQQYEFFKIDKMDERRNFVSWLRSPSGFTSTTKTAFCAVNTSSTTVQDKDGTIHNVYYGGPGYDDANKTKNVLLCFALGSGDTDVLDKMTLDRSVLG